MAPSAVQIELELINLDTLEPFTVNAGTYEIKNKAWGDAYKITFLDYDKTVQYG
jgi:hypothetical protein